MIQTHCCFRFWQLILLLSFSAPIVSQAQALTETQVSNLTAFAQVYGYVRWFYPGDEAQQVNWNQMAIYGASEVAKAKTPIELKASLESLFQPVAPGMVILPADAAIRFSPENLKPEGQTPWVPVGWVRWGLPHTGEETAFEARRTGRVSGSAAPELPFGNLSQTLKAPQIRGRRVRISAAMTLREGSTGQGQLWVQETRESMEQGWMDNLGDKPVKNSQWTTYTLEGTASPDAIALTIGGYLLGYGSLAMDAFKVEYDSAGTWVNLPLENPEFEGDAYTRGWRKQTDQHKTTIETEKPFLGSQSIRFTAQEPVIPTEAATPGAPQMGDHIRQKISADWQIVLPMAVAGDAVHTYPVADAQTFSSLTQQLKKYPKEGPWERIAVWIQAWNLVQFFHPFAPENWSESLPNGIKLAFPEMEVPAYCRLLDTQLSTLHDGQLHIFHPADRTLNGFPPIAMDSLEGKWVITHVMTTQFPLKPGDEVLEIEGIKVNDWVKPFRAELHASTHGYLRHQEGMRALRGPSKSNIKLKIRTAEGKKEYVLNRSLALSQWTELQASGLPAFKEIERGLVYADLTRITTQELPEVMEKMAEANRVILDLRGFAKNNHAFIGHFLIQPDTAGHWLRTPSPRLEGRTAQYRTAGWDILPTTPAIHARVVALISAESIGYTEGIIAMLKHYGIATLVGETTAGTQGVHINQPLAGGYLFSFTGMDVRLPNGELHFGKGITPDVEAHPTLPGYISQQDPIMEKALQVLAK